MDRKDMLERLMQGVDPLIVTIEKWKDIVNGVGVDEGGFNCALCETYRPKPSEDPSQAVKCGKCPIYEATGKPLCMGTPYKTFRLAMEDKDTKAANRAALEELIFLRRLQKNIALKETAEGIVTLKKLAHNIIDIVENALRDKYPVMEKLVDSEHNTLLVGETYYNLEDDVTAVVKEYLKRVLELSKYIVTVEVVGVETYEIKAENEEEARDNFELGEGRQIAATIERKVISCDKT